MTHAVPGSGNRGPGRSGPGTSNLDDSVPARGVNAKSSSDDEHPGDRNPERGEPVRTTRPPPVAFGLGIVVLAGLVALLFTGPGTDLDAASVVHTGSRIVHHFSYTPSRPPGSPVYEASVGVLHAIGGVPLVNLGSLVMAALCVLAFSKLCRSEGVDRWVATTLVLVCNPWFLIAATSIEDFVWALGLYFLGIVALRSKRPWIAGVLFALAIGCRSTTVLLVVCVLAVEAWEGRPQRRRAVTCGGVSMVLGAVLFVPAYVAAGRSFGFLRADYSTSSLMVQLGRFAIKDFSLFGPLAVLAIVVSLPQIVRMLGAHRTNWLVRFGLVGLVASQLLFLRFPWKMGHLLPTVAFAAILLGFALGKRPRMLHALVAAQLLYCVIGFSIVAPNHPNDATGGKVSTRVVWGPLVKDTQCRLRYRHDSLSPIRTVHERAGVCASPFSIATDGP